MLLPATLTACYALLFLATICIALWPILFQRAELNWRFELFSLDFSIGCLLTALIAAYTLGTLGAQLGFADSMLVAGRRAQIAAVLSGMVFGFGNLCFLASISLTGLARATIVTAGLLGFALGVSHAANGHLFLSVAAAFIALAATLVGIFSKTEGEKMKTPPSRPIRKGVRPPMLARTKGAIMAVLAGLSFACIVPLMGMVEPEELGIGAYGGILMAGIGIAAATIPLCFFFFNIYLLDGTAGFGSYLSGKLSQHLIGILDGFIWTIGALAVYAASTGLAKISHPETLLGILGGFALAALTGLSRSFSKRGVTLALILFLAAIALLALAFRP